MGFKVQDNAGKKLHKAARWEGRMTYTTTVKESPDLVPYITGYHKPMELTDHQKRQHNGPLRRRLAICLAWWVHSNMVWASDMDTSGRPEWFFSVYDDLLVGHTPLRGDCDDYALTFVEACIHWGLDPANIWILNVLSKVGQRSNRWKLKKNRVPYNHFIAGVMDGAGELWCIDSNTGDDHMPIKLSSSDYLVHTVHNMQDPAEVWYEGVMK